jgi:hypothetical protein
MKQQSSPKTTGRSKSLVLNTLSKPSQDMAAKDDKITSVTTKITFDLTREEKKRLQKLYRPDKVIDQ